MQLEELQDYAHLEAIRRPWAELVARLEDDLPYSTPEFLLPWTRLVGDAYRCRVLAAWDGERLVGLAPLFERAVGWPPLRLTLRSFPLHGTTPPFDLLLGEPQEAVMRAFVDFWKRANDWDLLELPNLRCASSTPRLLGAGGVAGLRLEARPGRRALYVPISGSWDDFLRARSPKFRYRYDLRRCARFGAVGFRHFPRDGIALDEALAAAGDVIARSWKRDDAGRRRWEGFLGELARSLHASGRLSLHLLLMDGRPVGYLFEIDHRGSRHAFHIAYDLAYQKAGPGVVLLAQAIRDAHAEGLRGYDLGGDEAYLRRWTDESIAHVDLRITRGSLPSRIKASVYVRIRERRKILARRRTEEKKNARKAAGATSAEADASDQ